MVFGETTASRLPHRPAMIPVFVAPRARADAGAVDSAVPRRVVPAGRAADRLTERRMNVAPLGLAAAPLPVGRSGAARAGELGPAPDRVPARMGAGRAAGRAVGERRARPRRGFCVRVALEDGDGLTLLEHSLPDRAAALPRPRADLPGGEPDAARGVRPHRHRRRRRRPAPVAVAGELADRPFSAAARFRGLAQVGAGRGGLRVRPGRRRRRARDPGRAGARRHHRARALPLPDRRREGAAAGGAPRLRAQGHRKALRGAAARRTAQRSPAASRATAPSPTHGPMRRRPRAIAGVAPPPRARGCARSRSSASASRITWATSATSATTAASRSASRSSRGSRKTCCAPTSRRSATGC